MHCRLKRSRIDCKNIHPCSDMVTLVPALTLTILSLLGNTCLGHKEVLSETREKSEKATVRKCCPWGQTYDAWYNCVHLPGTCLDLVLFTTPQSKALRLLTNHVDFTLV